MTDSLPDDVPKVYTVARQAGTDPIERSTPVSSPHDPDEPSRSLYPRLLGESWQNLDEAVRRLHFEGEPVHRIGVFAIRHGNSLVARRLAWLLRMPAVRESVLTSLRITSERGVETWDRSLGGARLRSTQREIAGGLIEERVGPLGIRFRLEVARRGLIYRQAGAVLLLFDRRFRLPAWLAPRVEASEEPVTASNGKARVKVAISIPLVGELLVYEGEIGQRGGPR